MSFCLPQKNHKNIYILDNELIMNSNFDKNFAPQLLLGLENLYKDRIFVDTTLVIGKTEIPVHRCVISGMTHTICVGIRR